MMLFLVQTVQVVQAVQNPLLHPPPRPDCVAIATVEGRNIERGKINNRE